MNIKKLIPATSIIILSVLACYGQPGKTIFNQGRDIRIDKWEVRDIVFAAKIDSDTNPFDVVFGAIFQGPDKKEMNIPGFYNDKSEWVIRFSSNVAGTWTFKTWSSQKNLAGLAGKVVASDESRPGQKGAVIIDPESPQQFMHEDGSPHFCLTFEIDWLFALDAENKTDIPRVRQVVKEISDNGFTQVVMNVYAYDVNWKKSEDVPARYDLQKPTVFPWKGTNEDPDYSGLSVDFFKHLDRVIHHLDDKGIVAHLMIYVWNKNVNWPEMYSRADNMFFDYVISRYQAFPNIIWDPSKEALDYGRCDIPYVNERIARVRNLDAFNRLLTVHDYEYNSREHHRVDFISIQTWRPNLYNLMLQARERHSDKPVVNIEHGGYEEGPYLSFEGNFVSAEQCLVRAYECVFAGVYTSYYWQNTSWDIIIWDAMEGDHGYQRPKYEYYKYMTGFFKRYNYNTLFPVEQKFTTNSRIELENLSTGGIPLTNGKDLFLFFIPSTTNLINAVLPKPDHGKLFVSWFNIYTGEYTPEKEINWTGWIEFRSPWKETDAVLMVKTNNP
jgi:hypothetical protein